jgi:transcriptional regulator with XRE-family HTH domain
MTQPRERPERPVSRYVAERMRERQLELGLSKSAVAERAGVAFSVVVDIERRPGQPHAPRTVTVDDLVALASALDTTPQQLLGPYGMTDLEEA